MQAKYSQSGKINYNIEKWIVDSLEEVKKIRCNTFGSTVYVIDTRETYILSGKGIWKSMNNKISEDIPSYECDCVEELTIWGDLAEDGTVVTKLY